jgi:hypothetical protein
MWRIPSRATTLAAACLGLSLAGCASEAPTALSADLTTPVLDASADKGHIGGWLNGESVRLRYTKPYFCAEPPSSGAPSGCVIGAEAEIAPRAGPIPLIYALVPVGILPDLATLHCLPGVPCLNHPTTIDFSRIGGPSSAPGAPHSHIIEARRAGWHQTVNIRVRDLSVWNAIAAAKSLTLVRQLQADPAIGGAGLISQDTPTNIYFFFEVQR